MNVRNAVSNALPLLSDRLPVAVAINRHPPRRRTHLRRHLGLVLGRRLVKQLALLRQVREEGMLGSRLLQGAVQSQHSPSTADIRGAPCQLLGVLARDHAQHQQIGNGLGIPGLLLHRLLQRGLRLFCPAEMQLGDGLRDETPHRRRRGCLRELLKDVKRLLVLVAALRPPNRQLCTAPRHPPENSPASCPPTTRPGSPADYPAPTASPPPPP